VEYAMYNNRLFHMICNGVYVMYFCKKKEKSSRENIGDVILPNYKLGRTLEHGSFDKVKVAPHIQKRENFVVKILK